MCPLGGFIKQQQIRTKLELQQQQKQIQNIAALEAAESIRPGQLGVSNAFSDVELNSDKLMENVRLYGNFAAATSVNRNASVQSLQSVLTSSSASSMSSAVSSSSKTKFHSFLQSSAAATTQHSLSSNFSSLATSASASDFHQALVASASKSSLASSVSTASLPVTGSQLVISPSFGKMLGEMEANSELKMKKSIQMNRKISILSPGHLSIRSEQSKEERTSCYINAEMLE